MLRAVAAGGRGKGDTETHTARRLRNGQRGGGDDAEQDSETLTANNGWGIHGVCWV